MHLRREVAGTWNRNGASSADRAGDMRYLASYKPVSRGREHHSWRRYPGQHWSEIYLTQLDRRLNQVFLLERAFLICHNFASAHLRRRHQAKHSGLKSCQRARNTPTHS